MTFTAYATADDLTDWLDTESPANADSLLRSATVLVAAAANRDPYNDTPTGTDVDVLRDATCAQAAAWVALDVDPATLGLDTAPVKGKKLGTADVTYDTAGQSEARTTAATTLAPQARDILYTGGLLALELPVWTSDTDQLPRYGRTRTSVGYGFDVERANATDAWGWW